MTTYLANYAHFTNKDDMDEAVDLHLSANRNTLNSTDRAVLDMIRRYSVKYGAAHLKHETMEKALDKSNATIRRTIRKLEDKNIIKRIHYIRPVMSGLGANIYVIKPFNEQGEMNSREDAEKPVPIEPQPVNSEAEALFSKSIITTKDLHTTSPTEQLSTTLFGRMKSLLSSTIGEMAIARKIFSVYRQQSSRMLSFSIHADKDELFEQLALQALHIAVQATKQKTVRNLPGYYSGVLRELIEKALFSNAFLEYDVPVEWLYKL
ncbi:hypothetical protein [Sporosarcina sp. YIM B06819]|uniref:hypothetical protein n=1 Tax=Sporosarcina sp. YIM B06819 TaxID=3081769 RepID=UPI00298CA1ED|nr:hypothetical protein [Sporosarcina sp. YIM B06819]